MSDEPAGAEIAKLKAEGLSWTDIFKRYSHLKKQTIRSRYRRWKAEHKGGEQDIDGDQVRFAVDGNNATLSGRGRITTLEGLLEAANVDLSVWRVDHYLVNKWEVGAKAKDQSIQWHHGVMDGYTEEHGLTIEPLFQVKAWLVRRHPEPLFPTIQPVMCAEREWQPRKSARTQGIGRSLVWTDPHFGYWRDIRTHELTPMHDEAALDIILAIAEDMQPDRIDILGDILDLADWSDKFLRSPELTETTQDAINAAHLWLRAFRARCPDAEIRAHEGNHDHRMEGATIKHLQAAYDLRPADHLEKPPAMSVPSLLALDALGIEWVGGYPADGDWLNDGVRLSHGEIAQSTPGSTARSTIDASDVTEVVGHCHRLEWISRVVRERGHDRVITGFSAGCACRMDGLVPSAKSRMEWQQGCAVIDYEIDGRWHGIYPVLIDGGRAIWDGKMYGD